MLSPGLSIGTITGNSSLDFGETARYVVEVASTSSHDQIVSGSGTHRPDGLVLVQLRDGYTPLVNDQVNIITAPSVDGLFDDVQVAVGLLPANLDVRLVYTPTSVDVKFVCISDLAPPFGVLDLQDVTGFVDAFVARDPLADIAEPIGVWDLIDVTTFIQNFLSGCN